MLIVSAVKICKQCLQTASASGIRPTNGASPLDRTGGFLSPSPGHLLLLSQNKISWLCHCLLLGYVTLAGWHL